MTHAEIAHMNAYRQRENPRCAAGLVRIHRSSSQAVMLGEFVSR